MYNTALTALHNKALAILGMIDEAKRREKDATSSFLTYISYDIYDIHEHYKARIQANKDLQSKLTRSYNSILQRINTTALK